MKREDLNGGVELFVVKGMGHRDTVAPQEGLRQERLNGED